MLHKTNLDFRVSLLKELPCTCYCTTSSYTCYKGINFPARVSPYLRAGSFIVNLQGCDKSLFIRMLSSVLQLVEKNILKGARLLIFNITLIHITFFSMCKINNYITHYCETKGVIFNITTPQDDITFGFAGFSN